VSVQAKRGRPKGSGGKTWALREPVNVAAHHANVLIELWLAGAPVLEIRVLLMSLARSPDHQAHGALIEECWHARGSERRYTVPGPIKRKLCQLAAAHVAELRLDAKLRLDDTLRQRALADERERLLTEGWTETQIVEILSRTVPKRDDSEAPPPPDVKKVLKLVNRRAPATTLRRKAAARRILRKH
jgi:hypothetical protein